MLRVYGRPRRHGPEVIESELRWLEALRREAGLPAPEPVRARDGALAPLVSFEGAARPRTCALLRWVPGRSGGEALGPRDAAQMGAYAAGLHNHSERHGMPPGFVRPRAWDWEWVFGESAPMWTSGGGLLSPGEIGVLRAAAERVREDLRELGEDRSVFGVIHRDLTPQNFVFHEGGAYAIDFDDCGPGHYLFDLAVSLSALEVYGGGRAREMQEALLEGYRSERPLLAGRLRHLHAFVALRVAQRLNRAVTRAREERRARHPGSRRPGYLEGPLEALRRFVALSGGEDPLRTPWWRAGGGAALLAPLHGPALTLALDHAARCLA